MLKVAADGYAVNRLAQGIHKTAAIRGRMAAAVSRPNGTGIGVYFFEMFQNSVTGALITPWRLSR